jgi:predicted nuclease with TOPRIM domain
MCQNQEYLEEQVQAYQYNLEIAKQLEEQYREYQRKNEFLQHQIYYNRAELDRLAEQVLSYEGTIQRLQTTIREQEEQIDRNHKLLAYDKTLTASLGQAIHTQSQPYVNQLMTFAMMNYTS